MGDASERGVFRRGKGREGLNKGAQKKGGLV